MASDDVSVVEGRDVPERGLDSPARRVLDSLQSRTAWTVGAFIDRKPLINPADLLDEDKALASYVEWIAKGESLFEAEMSLAKRNCSINPKVYQLYGMLLGEKRSLISIIRSSKKKSTDDIFDEEPVLVGSKVQP